MTDDALDRRTLLALSLAAAALPATGLAQPGRPAPIALWPAPPPGAPAVLPKPTEIERGEPGRPNRGLSGIAEPHIAPVLPANPNGAALVIIPGGGYGSEWYDKEGFEIADRFAADGITSFILRYRLPAEGWADRSEVPLRDAQRAIRLIRHRAADWRLDPKRVGVMGFSAGGHLAATVSTRTERSYAPVDAADEGAVQPDLSVLMYPVIDMDGPFAHRGSAQGLLGPSPSAETIARYSQARQVSGATPPTFLVHAMDDGVVPVENAFGYLAALRAAKVAAEAHIFEEGGHGFAIREAVGKPAAAWPDLFIAWASRRGFLKPA